MSAKGKLFLYLGLVLSIIFLIIIIWAFDTGLFGISASEQTAIYSVDNLQIIPSPDNSTFAKIFTFLIRPFSQ